MGKERINYSQCWEDPQILLEALSIRDDDYVLSVTSGGDNTLALLLAGPKKVFSIDLNAAQNHLLEFKRIAARKLNYEEYLELLGVQKSKCREILFKKIAADMSSSAQIWWAGHIASIKQGAIHCGRFERFTRWVARYLLPLVHSKKAISKLLACRNADEQKNYYGNQWDTKRWRFFFYLASNRPILRRYARPQGMFTYANVEMLAEIYRKRLERHLASVPIEGNFFLHYSLTGEYGNALPPYLEKKNFLQLRNMPNSTLSIITDNLLNYLKSMPSSSFSKFNLSDIFEALSPIENEMLWEQIVRTAKPDAKIVYWNNLIQRSYPSHLSSQIKTNEKHVDELRKKDRVFFYDNLCVYTILK